MKKINLILLNGVVFFICCSMSQCHEDKTPGPITTVHGFVKETITGNPIANVQLQVTKEYTTLLSGNKYSDYNTITTGADGSYILKFTPLGTGKFYFGIISSPPNYSLDAIQSLVLGSDNNLNFTLEKLINLNVHLKNKSNQNKSSFHIFIFGCCDQSRVYESEGGIGRVVVDTTLNYKLPQLTLYTFQSLYYNVITSGPNVGLFGDTLSFKKHFYISKNDTALTIINP